MSHEVADGVRVHRSAFMRSNGVVVDGRAGVLVVDPGVLEPELVALADELDAAGRPVVAGFATHPHWDHLLWHARLGPAPRLATDRCAATVRERLPDDAARARAAAVIPPDIVDRVPLGHLGPVTAVPADATHVPWDGPPVRIVEHRAHAAGHAALVIEDRGVLVAGDMLSDILIPMLDMSSADPVGDHLAALQLIEDAARGVGVVVPGHGSVGDGDELTARIALDRAYLHALRAGGTVDDPRLHPSAYGADFLPALHEGQVQAVAARRGTA